MSERLHNRTTRSGGLGALAVCGCTLALIGSCQGPPKSAGFDDVEVDLQVEMAAEEPPPSNDLSALTQRDVDAFLDMREKHAERERLEAVPSGPEILWNAPRQTPKRSSEQGTRATHGSLRSSQESKPQLLATDAKSLDPVQEADAADDADDEQIGDDGGRSVSAIEADHLRSLLVDLSKELYREASYADMPLRELLLIAATTLVSPDRALVPDAIPGLTSRERELLAHFQSFFIELGKKLDGSRNADEVLQQEIEALRELLVNEPRLELGTLALCTRVGGFGDYTPFKKNSFLAHSEQQAIVYIEIAGFTSELNSKNEWVTELSQQLIIYSESDGIPVWREDWQSAVDVSRNRRNDFFVVQIITLPKALSVGRYHLKVRVRDEKSKAEAEGAINFEMVADARMATGG